LDAERVSQLVSTRVPRSKGTCVFSHGAGNGVVGGLRESYTGNSRAVYEWCLEQGVKAVWLHASSKISDLPGAALNFRTLHGAMTAIRSVVSMGGNNNGAPWPLISDRTWVIQGWHGTPLKAIGRAWHKHPNPRNIKILERPDFFISAGTEYTKRYMQCYFVREDQFWETGNPRNDALFRARKASSPTAQRQHALRLRLGMPALRHVILYAPTWREYISEPTFLNVGGRNLDQLNDFLSSRDAILVLRAHHREAKAAMVATTGFKNIVVSDSLDLTWDVTDWLIASDLLITDFSSVFFDYLVLDRPIIHVTSDLEEYATQRGFLTDPYRDFAGPTVRNQDELLDQIDRALTDPQSDALLRRTQNDIHNPFEDGHSSERVGLRIMDLLERPRTPLIGGSLAK
jgi:CDP-glycerol glycerophosphotransferase